MYGYVSRALYVRMLFIFISCVNRPICINKFFYAIFCPGTMTNHAESINSDLQRGLDRRLRHTTVNTEQNK